MWPFKKRKNQVVQSEVPQEIKEYYQAERRERKGIAGLLAVATLIVTILVASALFFGGRWAYRKIAGTNKPNKPAVTQPVVQAPQSNGQKPSDNQTGTTKGAQTTPSPTAPQQGTSSAVTTTPGSATPPAGSTPLPRTGPDLDL